MLKSLRAATYRVVHRATPDSHAQVFVARYERLLRWAIQLTGNCTQAQDIVQDAFIHFVLVRPDFEVANVDGYLRRTIRNLFISHIRRDKYRLFKDIDSIEPESADELCLDPRLRLEAREELRSICQWACVRKQTSKAASALILRLLYDFGTHEIALVMKTARKNVLDWLKIARKEARVSSREAETPEGLGPVPGDLPLEPFDLLAEMRYLVIQSRVGDCLTRTRISELYSKNNPLAIDCETLAHIVSCTACFEKVADAVGLRPLQDRPRGGCGTGGPGDPGDIDPPELLLRALNRAAKDVFDHRPEELLLCVNGYEFLSAKVGTELNQKLALNTHEVVSFIEVFSEKGTNLLLLNVTPPVDGALQQSTSVRLSGDRILTLTVDFSGPVPTLQIVYLDPKTEAATMPSCAPSSAHRVVQNDIEEHAAPWHSALHSFLTATWRPFIRPLAGFAVVAAVIGASYLLLNTPSHRSLDGAKLLADSARADVSAAVPGRALHRSILLREQDPSTGVIISNQRIEQWQGADGRNALRVYNDKHELLAGEWRGADGRRVIYQHSKLRQTPPSQGNEISEDLIWRLTPSADNFARLTANPQEISVEEEPEVYVLHYRHSGTAVNGLQQASLTLRRSDLHAIAQTFRIESDGKVRDYAFSETALENLRIEDIPSSVLEIDSSLGMPLSVGAIPPIAPPMVSLSADTKVTLLGKLDALHALSEDVNVALNQDGSMSIHAIVPSEESKQGILAALAPFVHNPAIRITVNTHDEVEAQQLRSTQPRLSVQSVEAGNRLDESNSELVQYYSRTKHLSGDRLRERVQVFTDSVLARLMQARSHALTLQRVVDAITTSEMAEMSAESQLQYQAIVAKHAAAVEIELRALKSELSPIYKPETPGEQQHPVAQPAMDSKGAVARLNQVLSAAQKTIWTALTPPFDRSASAELKSGQFWTSLEQAQRTAQAISEPPRNY